MQTQRPLGWLYQVEEPKPYSNWMWNKISSHRILNHLEKSLMINAKESLTSHEAIQYAVFSIFCCMILHYVSTRCCKNAFKAAQMLGMLDFQMNVNSTMIEIIIKKNPKFFKMDNVKRFSVEDSTAKCFKFLNTNNVNKSSVEDSIAKIARYLNEDNVFITEEKMNHICSSLDKYKGTLDVQTLIKSEDERAIDNIGNAVYYKITYDNRDAVLKVGESWTTSFKANDYLQFWREAYILAELDGAGAAPKLYLFDPDVPAILMEHCKGKRLRNLQVDKWNESDLISVLKEVALKLQEIDHMNMSHRTINGFHILVEEPLPDDVSKPKVRLIHFQCARVCDVPMCLSIMQSPAGTFENVCRRRIGLTDDDVHSMGFLMQQLFPSLSFTPSIALYRIKEAALRDLEIRPTIGELVQMFEALSEYGDEREKDHKETFGAEKAQESQLPNSKSATKLSQLMGEVAGEKRVQLQLQLCKDLAQKIQNDKEKFDNYCNGKSTNGTRTSSTAITITPAKPKPQYAHTGGLQNNVVNALKDIFKTDRFRNRDFPNDLSKRLREEKEDKMKQRRKETQQ
ncbi:hypothetical protein SK128_004079 [Halocaridina rubra]|uniref:Protein kinase domain-containing protein n=1 Tax=Halocaridina rubra TaxID=373956 RepID=A0AAN8WXG2_HALRR